MLAFIATEKTHDPFRSGWSTLADECGIALLFPGQRLTNNLLGGSNWFETGDGERAGGEPLSIRQMIKQVVDNYAVDPSRVFITGMSSDGIAKLLAACRRELLVCKLRHHLDGVFCPEAERVSFGVAV